MTPARSRIKPTALQPGDTLGIIAPASSFDREAFQAGCRELERRGYRPFYFESIFERDLYFAGSGGRRAEELHEMFRRDDIRAILCVRGGYGANYLLPHLDLELIGRHPKILAGYSDITCLLTYLSDAADLVTFHAPMVAKDFAHSNGVDSTSWNRALTKSDPWSMSAESGIQGLSDGEAEGLLYGGCLSLVAASLGTPYEIRTEDTILFLEDVATKPYQIDRMLMQLKLAGKLALVRGIVFGQMLDCIQPSGQSYTLQEVVTRVLGDTNVPIAYGLRSGHVTESNITLPMGVRARLGVRGSEAALEILESAVSETSKVNVHRG